MTIDDKANDHRRGLWETIAVCSVVFGLGVGVRLLELARWDPQQLRAGGEWLLATHDAYLWVAGAEGANAYAAGMPMSVLLSLFAWAAPPATVAFWASAVLGGLAMVPLALWAAWLRTRFARWAAPVLATLAPAYYFRSRLGFFDTDWAALFFPLLTGWLLAVCLRPSLRPVRGGEAGPGASGAYKALPYALMCLAAFGRAWHAFIGLYLLGVLCLGLLLVWWRGRREARLESVVVLLGMALAVGLGWMGALAGALLVLAGGWGGVRSRAAWFTPLVSAALASTLVWVGLARYGEYLLIVAPAYLGTDEAGNPAAPDFPDPGDSIRETQPVGWREVLEGAAFHPLLGVLGLVGLAAVVIEAPAAAFLLPLLGLGVAAVLLGIRFTMFAAPPLLLGLTAILERGGAWLAAMRPAQTRRLRGWTIGGTGLAILLLALGGMRAPVETVLSRPHAEALLELGQAANGEGIVWTWWDYGYATQHFSRLATVADGSRNTGPHLYSLGAVLGAESFEISAAFMTAAAESDFEPWEVWEGWDAARLQAWREALEAGELPAAMDPGRQFLVVSWEGLQALPWIQYFGGWDVIAQEGRPSRVVAVPRPQRLELDTGVFEYDGDQQLEAATVDVVGEAEATHYAFASGGPHILVNDVSGEVMLLDDAAYRSTFVQLLIQPAQVFEAATWFGLVVERQPAVRIFELRMTGLN